MLVHKTRHEKHWKKRWPTSQAPGQPPRSTPAAARAPPGDTRKALRMPRGSPHKGPLGEGASTASRLAEGLAGLPGVSLDPATVETNIVFFELTGEVTAADAVDRLLAHGVRMGALGHRTVRAVTHLDVDAAGIERALAAARAVFDGRNR